MKKALFLFCAIALSLRAHASFHLWKIDQIYSNADGSVQFVEMLNPADGENLLFSNGAKLDSIGATNATFNFPSNLSSNQTANHHLLIATGPIAGVTPDFTLPAHFLNLTNGTIQYGNPGETLDVHSYTSLPVDGIHALHFSGSQTTIGYATPTNFNGDSVKLGADVLTHHNDNQRTGLNANESILTPSTVDVGQFGKLFSHNVDGYVYAQPLVLRNVAIPKKGTHTVLFVATEHDSVYAFDADNALKGNAAPLWHRSFINPAAGITTVPAKDTDSEDLVPEIGITSTPVIDAGTGTLYCLAKTKEHGHYVQRLHALDITTGKEKPGGPKIIDATMPGTGDGSDGTNIRFNPLRQAQRPALLLLNGNIYIAWASHGDNPPYHGIVMGYDAQTLAQVAVLNLTPDGYGAGIWQSGCGLASDTNNHIFCTTGNGTFDLDGSQKHIGNNYGDCVLRLKVANDGSLSIDDFFCPADQIFRDDQDADLGSSGIILLPAQSGTTPNLTIVSGKTVDESNTGAGPFISPLYVLDRDNLGGFDQSGDHVVQKIDNGIVGLFGTPAFFNNTLYIHGSDYGGHDMLKAFTLTSGTLALSSSNSAIFGFPGATPSISASGTSGGIVWEIERENSDPAVLHAYAASDVSLELYNSTQAPQNRDALTTAMKFVPATVANGKVYVASLRRITTFGLLHDTTPPTLTISAPLNGARTRNPTITAKGKASDRYGVAKVEYWIENAANPTSNFQTANGTTTWSFDTSAQPLQPGANTIHVRATDVAGNISTPDATRKVTLVQ